MTTANQKGHTAARRRQLAPKARKALLTKKAARTGKASGASLKKQLLGEVRNLRGTARTNQETIAHLKKKLAALLAQKKTPKTLIPRPEGKFNLKSTLGRLAGISGPKYTAIRRDVRAFAFMCRLNDKKTWHGQDPSNIGSLFTKMNELHPVLKRFAGHWPVRCMIVQYLQNRRKGRKRAAGAESNKSVFDDDEADAEEGSNDGDVDEDADADADKDGVEDDDDDDGDETE